MVITLCCGWAPLTAGADGGRVSGIVTYEGAIPHSAVADNAGVKQPLLEIDSSEGRGLRHAVVYLKLPGIGDQQRPRARWRAAANQRRRG